MVRRSRVETRLEHRERAQQGWKPQAGGASKLPEGHLLRLPFP